MAALDGLLLSPAEVSTAMGATAMAVAAGHSEMFDESAHIPDRACLPAYGPGQLLVYIGSGYTATRNEELKEPDEKFDHFVVQAVVAFPTAADAGAFFNASTQSWVGCSNRQYIHTLDGQPAHSWVVGAVSNNNGTLSLQKTQQGANGWGCERALTVRNNVAVDIMACATPPGDAGLSIAHPIAAKVGPD
ncbi:sensor domain-containing protein [uncultured Mycobacterium sp.]|uniref:sensor domain-containing protein n=1 Tax=uncultured Mycobacterium sp. TaxID=171292 RepID=UPI0035CC7650